MKINQEFMCADFFLLSKAIKLSTTKKKNRKKFKVDRHKKLFFGYFDIICKLGFSLNISKKISKTDIHPSLHVSLYMKHAKLWPLIVENANHIDPLHGIIVPVKHIQFSRLLLHTPNLFYSILFLLYGVSSMKILYRVHDDCMDDYKSWECHI